VTASPSRKLLTGLLGRNIQLSRSPRMHMDEAEAQGLKLSYKLNDSLSLRAGVNNLFDKGLPFVASSQNGTDLSVYDAIGRSFYAGVKFAF